MGLRGEFKKYQRRQEILDFLHEFGITEEMLKKIPSLFEEKQHETRSVPTESEAKEFTQKYQNAKSIEDLVEQFAGEVEEFYPNGRK